jgi:AmmeMemoRadiSam system protein A
MARRIDTMEPMHSANLSPEAEMALIELIRLSLRQRLSSPSEQAAVSSLLAAKRDELSPTARTELDAPAGCFVTLHRHADQKLRGCIGRLDASQALWVAAADMARGVLEDPRFVDDPVTLAELNELDVEVSILSPLQPASSPEDFDLLNEGIYLTCGGRTGCFLPQVAQETGWSRQQLLDRLCTEKMGLPEDAWRGSGAKLSKFQCKVVGPAPINQATR